MFNWIRELAFKRKVKDWITIVRLHRELEKEIRKLQRESINNDNEMVVRLNLIALDNYMPEYRKLNDQLTRERIERLRKKLVASRKQTESQKIKAST